MIFKKEKKYKSSLQINELLEKLNYVTEKHYSSSSNHIQFEGDINTSGFTILPTFNYSPNEILRPEIVGKLKEKIEGTEILIKFHLTNGLKNLLIFALVLNMGIISLMIGMPNLTDFTIWDKWWLLIIFFMVTILIFQGYFSFKVNKSENVLKGLLKMS